MSDPAGLRRCGYPGRLRRYQSLALDAFAASRAAGAQRAYFVMPPGSGKTVLGLEIARRLERQALVLTPNSAVQSQWVSTWDRFRPGDAGDPQAGVDRDLDSAITVLTYQTLATLDNDPDGPQDPEDADDLGSEPPDPLGHASPRARRAAAVRSGDTATLLALLHPNGRALVERAARLGPWTLVLDECHHLLETWGALVVALVEALGPDTFVIGLTATPPTELPARQAQVQAGLFGAATFAVPTPAVVKEGELAPYQELAYLTEPTVEEQAWVSDQAIRFTALQLQLAGAQLGSIPLFAWLERRLVERRVVRDEDASPSALAQQGGQSGNQLSWAAFASSAPELARAGLRFAADGAIPLPDGARLREEHRQPPDAQDWVVVLADFCRHLSASSNPADQDALQDIRAVLPSLGYRLTRQGVRATTSPIDRLCALSSSKAAATAHLLGEEAASRGADLRALVLCDFEAATPELPASLRGSGLPPAAGSSRLVLMALAAALAPDASSGATVRGGLRPVLVTGRTIAAAPGLAQELARFCEERSTGLRLVAQPLAELPQLHRLTATSGRWTARIWTPLVTAFFATGQARVLVGTRALLGEGWDAPGVNVTVDLSGAATATAITQMRGRSLRLDPERPDKVASNWTVTCVADGHPRGDADYARLVRKHQTHLAPAGRGLALSTDIESGVSHCDDRLSPYAPPDSAARSSVTADALSRSADRGAVTAAWQIGLGYTGVEVTTLRVRAGRSFGLAGAAGFAGTDFAAGAALLSSTDVDTALPPVAPRRSRGIASRAALTAAVVLGPGAVAGVAGPPVLGLAVGGGLALGGAGAAALRVRAVAGELDRRRSTAAVEQLAGCLADALHDIDALDVGAQALQVGPDENGWLRLSLLGVPPAQSQLFATALDELLGPIGEPRYLIARLVVPPPTTHRQARRLALRRLLGRPILAGVAYHAVPSYLGANRARADAFAAVWERDIGPSGSMVLAASAEGQAIIELFRGADPFAVTSQLRTMWT